MSGVVQHTYLFLPFFLSFQMNWILIFYHKVILVEKTEC